MGHVRAWAIRYQDRFWEGDAEAAGEAAFGPLGGVRAFPEKIEAEHALEVLDLDESIRKQCRVVAIVIFAE